MQSLWPAAGWPQSIATGEESTKPDPVPAVLTVSLFSHAGPANLPIAVFQAVAAVAL